MILTALAFLASSTIDAPGFAGAPAVPPEEIDVEEIETGLENPWSLAFLPDGDVLVTEKPGRLRVIRDGELLGSSVTGVPEVFAEGQGGLFDVVLHPDFDRNGLIYLTFAKGTAKRNTLALARARYSKTAIGGALEDVEVVFEARAWRSTSAHYGGRLAFLPDGTLLLTSGEGYAYREQAQKLDTHFGKVLRLTEDGVAAPGNPFAAQEGALPEIWSYGHRNPQGIVVTAEGVVFENEHGARGGDEVNRIEPGVNYGWPMTTYGVDYSGAQITPFASLDGVAEPLFHWTPSIAPSSLAVYEDSLFRGWDGYLLSGALAGRHVRLADPSTPDAEQQTLLASRGSRIRDVTVAPDGSIWVATESGGEDGGAILRLTPAR